MSAHFPPASSERQRRPFGVSLPFQGWPSPTSMSAYTRSELARVMARPTLPHGFGGRPLPSTGFQGAPPSLERYIPLPGPPLSRPQVWISSCHIPANRTRGLLGSITRSEQPVFSSTNSVFAQVLPPSL